MFDKKPKTYTDQLGKTNRIVEGTKIKGDIHSVADFRLDGELIGNFQCERKLGIASAGTIIGDINCKKADIEGIFRGKIIVEELLNVKSTAHIEGEVTVSKLAVEPGAVFSATCAMKTNVKNLIPLNGEQAQQKTI